MVKAPQQFTKEEYQRHRLTHTPYEPWCKHCASGRTVRTQHGSRGRSTIIVPDVEAAFEGPTKISMDYVFLCDRSIEQSIPPRLVVVGHKYGLVWAYQVPNKGVMGGAHWLPKRLVSAWDNTGMGDAVIQLNADQDPSIVNMQTAMQAARQRGAIPTNSPVGESECNGRVRNSIRRAQEGGSLKTPIGGQHKGQGG